MEQHQKQKQKLAIKTTKTIKAEQGKKETTKKTSSGAQILP